MVTTTQADELLAEVAEAEAAGLQAEELQTLRGEVEGAAAVGMGMTYEVPETDKAAWIAAYRLSVDWEGIERGAPVKLAKGGLGSYLSKKRPVDGGRLFTLKMPTHLEAPPTFQCFVVPSICRSKSDTKMNLIDHMEAAHPRESVHFKKQIDMIRDAAMDENPALQAIVQAMAKRPDPGAQAVPQVVREQYDAAIPDVDTKAGVVETLSIPTPACVLCPWPAGAERWKHEAPTQQALKMHIFAKHRNEVE